MGKYTSADCTFSTKHFYQQLLKSNNASSSYSEKCRGCFLLRQCSSGMVYVSISSEYLMTVVFLWMFAAGLRSTAELRSSTCTSVEPLLTHCYCLWPVSSATRPLSTYAVTVSQFVIDMHVCRLTVWNITLCSKYAKHLLTAETDNY